VDDMPSQMAIEFGIRGVNLFSTYQDEGDMDAWDIES
jgi:hypothetical protein